MNHFPDTRKKLRYLFKQRYNPHPMYWFDLLTERHIKNRTGECKDCFDCCKYTVSGHCKYVDVKNKRCTVYNDRQCDQWFPVSQKELDYMKKVKPGIECKFGFKNINSTPQNHLLPETAPHNPTPKVLGLPPLFSGKRPRKRRTS